MEYTRFGGRRFGDTIAVGFIRFNIDYSQFIAFIIIFFFLFEERKKLIETIFLECFHAIVSIHAV